MKKGLLFLTTAALFAGFLTLSSCGEEKKGGDTDSTAVKTDTADSSANSDALENLEEYNDQVNNTPATKPAPKTNPDLGNQLGTDVKVGEEVSTVAVEADVKVDDGKTETGRMNIGTKTEDGGGRAKIGGGDGTGKTGGRAKIGGGN